MQKNLFVRYSGINSLLLQTCIVVVSSADVLIAVLIYEDLEFLTN